MRLSINFLLVIFSCYIALAFSETVFIPAEPCSKSDQACTKDFKPYCIKQANGNVEQRFGSGSCPPCGNGISYYKGYCPDMLEL